ncbi:MAG: hypothetical protein J1E82_04660 [Muribaculaceae bacterium]|nr:hypothetical protein [Muribaculaceae bacterium]
MNSGIQKYITIIFFLISAFSSVKAQSIRDITVAYNKSFTDHVSLASDSRDMDVIVKFIFNEDTNQLTVSLISYRYLFVFREDSRYGNIIHHNRLDPEDLPYVAEFPEKSRFILSKKFINFIPKPHKDYIFTKWIEYRGLQPVAMKYKMVNDYIEQTFDVTNYGKNVMVKLGYIFLMEKTPSKKHPDDYTFVAGKNLNLEYRISIVRNPCFGLENEIELAKNTLDAVEKAYRNFSGAFKTLEVETEAELTNFNNMKEVLLTQFQVKESDSQCPELKELWDEYNSYVESIASLNLTLKIKEKQGTGGNGVASGGNEGEGGPINIDPAEISTLARQIDRNVSRWLLSKDTVEKQDLVRECQDIISEVNGLIGIHQGSTQEQKRAVGMFRQAEAYFRNTCGVKK